MNSEIVLTLGVLVLALVLFIWGRLRADVVGLIVMGTVMVLGLVTPAEAVSGFANEAVITVGAMFVLSSGLLRTGAIELLGRGVSRLAGASELRLLVVSLAIIIPLSAFVNNTPVVAVMVPLILGLTRETGIAPSRIFMPISFGSQMGGTLTLIGTSTNLLVAGLVLELGLPRIGLFDITPPALVLGAVGLVYLFTIGRLLLPTRKAADDLEETYDLRDYMTVVRVLPDSPFAGKTLEGTRFGETLGLQVVAIERDDHPVRFPRGSTVVHAGDVLVATGKIRDIARIAENEHLEILSPEPHVDVLTGAAEGEPTERRLAEVIVPPQSPIAGRTLRDLNFRRRYDMSVLGIQRHGVNLRENFGEVRLRIGDTLLVEALPADLQKLHESGELALLGAVDLPARRTRKMTLALGIMLAVVGLAAFDVAPIMMAAVLGVIAMFVTGCLQPQEAWEDVDWMVLILIGSILPLGIAIERSGTAALIGEQVAFAASWAGPYGAVALIYLATSILTEIISNNAAAVVLVPVAIATAAGLAISPMPLVIAVMLAASNSFMTPVGYQTNTFVYAPGGYRFADFLRVGGPLNVVMLAAATFVIPIFFPF